MLGSPTSGYIPPTPCEIKKTMNTFELQNNRHDANSPSTRLHSYLKFRTCHLQSLDVNRKFTVLTVEHCVDLQELQIRAATPLSTQTHPAQEIYLQSTLNTFSFIWDNNTQILKNKFLISEGGKVEHLTVTAERSRSFFSPWVNRNCVSWFPWFSKYSKIPSTWN